jgi:hypothetical protein
MHLVYADNGMRRNAGGENREFAMVLCEPFGPETADAGPPCAVPGSIGCISVVPLRRLPYNLDCRRELRGFCPTPRLVAYSRWGVSLIMMAPASA